MSVKIDYSRDSLLTDFSIKTLQDRYLVGDEKSPQALLVQLGHLPMMTIMLKNL